MKFVIVCWGQGEGAEWLWKAICHHAGRTFSQWLTLSRLRKKTP